MSLTAWPSPLGDGEVSLFEHFSLTPAPLPRRERGFGWAEVAVLVKRPARVNLLCVARPRESGLLRAIGDFRTAYETGPFGSAMKVRQECDNTGW